MAGLLGLEDDPASQGLLSLGLRLMSTPGSFMSALGQSGLGAMGDLNSAAQAKQRRDLLAQEQRSREQQMQIQAQAMKQAQAEQQRQEAIRQAYAGAMRSPEQQAMGQFGGPTNAAAQAAPGMAPQFDQQALIRSLSQVDPMTAYQMAQPKAKKLSKLEPMRGPDGKMINVAVYEDGTTSVLPYGVRPDIALQNLGNRVQAIDKNDTSGGQSFAMGQSPDSAASNAVTMRGQNMTDERSRDANAGQLQNGRIPQGYRMKLDGTLEAIPGGPADIKSGELGAKAEAKKAGTISQANSVLDTISDAKNLVGINTAGVGSWLSVLPATDARNLGAKLETVKANLGFDRLQQMRDQSPTGGALGAVAVQELTALQSTVASLDQAQSPAQLEKALTKIDGHYRKWLETMGAPRKNPVLDTQSLYKEADNILNGGR